MRRAGFIFLALAILGQWTASALDICVVNEARLDPSAVQSFHKELGAILSASRYQPSFTSCGPGVVTLTIRREPPAEETSALGATLRRNGRLLPAIEIYVAPTVQIVGTSLPGVVGRAMARVATHELGHWLTQGSAHAVRGVMMERLSAAHLMARDRGFFRLPPAP